MPPTTTTTQKTFCLKVCFRLKLLFWIKIEEFTLRSRSKIIPNQENALYETIISNSNIIIKKLDLRRSSLFIQEINANLQAEASIRLISFKNTVNQYQAKIILNRIYSSDKIKLQCLLLGKVLSILFMEKH